MNTTTIDPRDRSRTRRRAARALLALAALLAGGVQAGTPGDAGAGPAAADPQAAPPAAAPRRFVTRHSLDLHGQPLAYQVVAGETLLYDQAGEATASVFSFSYLKDAAPVAQRPVLFVFNGGPGSSSVWLHLGVAGPRRLVLDREVDPSSVPPFGLADNPDTLLDVADLVFIDPVGTGWSRTVGKGRDADFWGVNEDAEAMAQFIEQWLSEHARWNSPKYVMGESYGSVRSAVLALALMGGPTYTGVMRGITLDGIVMLGTTLEPRDVHGAPQLPAKEALELPAIACTAWYHRRIGRDVSLEQLYADAYAYATGPYARAIASEKAGTLTPAARAQVAAQLARLTGEPEARFARSIVLSAQGYADSVLAGQDRQVGIYDSRYSLPRHNAGTDPVADDPAMGRYVPGFVSAFHQLASDELRIDIPRPYGIIVWKRLLAGWNWNRAPLPQERSFAADLGIAMRRNPDLRVLVASGYFDLATPAAVAQYTLEQARLPAERLTFTRYPSGHMLYLGDTAGAFAEDVRALIRRGARPPLPARVTGAVRAAAPAPAIPNPASPARD